MNTSTVQETLQKIEGLNKLRKVMRCPVPECKIQVAELQDKVNAAALRLMEELSPSPLSSAS